LFNFSFNIFIFLLFTFSCPMPFLFTIIANIFTFIFASLGRWLFRKQHCFSKHNF
jgi:hypothetical protein